MTIEREHKINLRKYEELKNRFSKLESKLNELNATIAQYAEEKKTFETKISEMKRKVTVLQQELDNSEVVQKDFVLLSQSLQVMCYLTAKCVSIKKY